MNWIITTIKNQMSPRKIDIREVAASTVSRHKKALRMLAEYDRT